MESDTFFSRIYLDWLRSTNYAIGQIRSYATEIIFELIHNNVWVLCFFKRNGGFTVWFTRQR